MKKEKGLFFYYRKLNHNIDLPLISELFCDSENEWLETFSLIISNIISENNGNMSILITNELDISLTKKIEKKLQKFINNKQLVFTKK